MVPIPKKLFIESITIGNIYLLKKHKLKNTSEAHYFIVVGKSDSEIVLFSCCTSQFEKRKRHIELAGLPLSTLVQIKSDTNNNLPDISYIDCNSVFDHTLDELFDLYGKRLMKYIGNINDGKIEEIKTGIIDSPLIEGDFKTIIGAS